MRPFVDTNVLVYAHDVDQPEKQARALAVLAEHAETMTLSAQILSEFYVAVTRKLTHPLAVEDAAVQVDELSRTHVVATDSQLVRTGISLSRSAQLSYWDALMLAAARRADCEVVLTEDLPDGAVLAGVRVHDPFTES